VLYNRIYCSGFSLIRILQNNTVPLDKEDLNCDANYPDHQSKKTRLPEDEISVYETRHQNHECDN